MIGLVKINYGQENQGCAPFTGGLLFKICFILFRVHRELSIVENRKFLKYFKMVYNPGFSDNVWYCEDKLWAIKSGFYTIHRWSFA